MSAALNEVQDSLENIRKVYAHLIDASKASYRGDPSRTKVLMREDLKLLAEGLLLGAHVSLETFVREYFFEILDGIHPQVTSVTQGLPQERVYDVVYANTKNRRIDWLPLDGTIERAGVLFTSNDPFARLRYRPQTRQWLKKMAAARNKVAHSGEEAAGKYEEVVTGEAALAEPGAWLLAASTNSPKVNNLESILITVGNVVDAATSPAPNLTSLLGPPEQLAIKTRVAAARFQCTQCQNAISITTYKEQLPACPSCPPEVSGKNRWVIDN